MSTRDIKEMVKESYALAARRAATGGSSCCRVEAAFGGSHLIGSNLYDTTELSQIPQKAMCAWLGCGNPSALAKLRPGEIVLDLGSGGGLDVLLAARRVGKTGKVYGLDLTDEMLELARQNQQESGITNAQFLKGDIESIPLQESSVDVVISNNVINLAEDKDQVLREVFRVLRPGGRLAVSDVVVIGEVSSDVRRSVELWLDCLGGALEESQYRSKLTAAGFREIDIVHTGKYCIEGARQFSDGKGANLEALPPGVEASFISAFICATKPLSSCFASQAQ